MVTETTITNCFNKAFRHPESDENENSHDVLMEIDLPHNMNRGDFEACVELEGENDGIDQDTGSECDAIESEESEDVSPVENFSTIEVLKALRLVQNWGQVDGLPDLPLAMEQLMKMENALVLRKFQNTVQTKITVESCV